MRSAVLVMRAKAMRCPGWEGSRLATQKESASACVTPSACATGLGPARASSSMSCRLWCPAVDAALHAMRQQAHQCDGHSQQQAVMHGVQALESSPPTPAWLLHSPLRHDRLS